MRFADAYLISRKIIVGVIVTLVPFFLFFGGLWLVRHFFNK
jgi:hypothetical protein